MDDSRIRRSRSAPPISINDYQDLSQNCKVNNTKNSFDCSSATLEEIRNDARNVWSHKNVNLTSYQDHYKQRYSDSNRQGIEHHFQLMKLEARPASPTRRNKPHPSEVFLVTRLHSVPGDRLTNVPGYHNADSTLGKDAYKVDGSLPAEEQDRRANLRQKFVGRPTTSAIARYNTIPELDAVEDPVERQATEAWLKLASDKDRDKVMAGLRAVRFDERNDTKVDRDRCYRPRTMAACHRYLRESGAAERKYTEDAYRKCLERYGNERDTCADEGVDVVALRKRDIDKTRHVHYVHKSRRGDFLIHPEWPPSIKHHRLNGLSSVDIPFSPHRR